MTTISRQSPLSEYERKIIAAAANKAMDIFVEPNDIWTIRTDATTGTFWLHLRDGKQLPFDLKQFRDAVDQAKKEIATQLRVERSAQKVARELMAGDKIVHSGKEWTVTSVKPCRVDGRVSRSNLHAVKMRLTIFDGTSSRILLPYSEANFEIRELAAA